MLMYMNSIILASACWSYGFQSTLNIFIFLNTLNESKGGGGSELKSNFLNKYQNSWEPM